MTKQAGRPTVRTPEVIEAILLAVAEGENLSPAVKKAGIGWTTFWEWCKEDQELSDKVARARSIGIECNLETAERILMETYDNADSSSGPRVNAANNIAHFHKWRAAQLSRAVYGEKKIISGDLENPLTITLLSSDGDL